MISRLVFHIYSLPLFVKSISCIFLPSSLIQTQALFVLVRKNQPQKNVTNSNVLFCYFFPTGRW